MSAVALPLMFLNLLAGLVGGVWLLALGKWQVVVLGLAATLCGTFVISLLLLPSMLLMLPFARDETAGEPRSTFFIAAAGAIGIVYTYCVMAAWAITAFLIIASGAGAAAKIPALLYSYATSTSVWNYMAQQELRAGNEYSSISAFFHQLGCVSLMLYGLMEYPRLDAEAMIVWYAPPMVLSVVVQLWLVVGMTRDARRY